MKEQLSKSILIILIVGLILSGNVFAQKKKGRKKSKSDTQESATTTLQPIAVNWMAPFESADSVNLPDHVIAYARTLIGTPYLYASIDPKKGFDCSGFITHVFSHFNLMVPRSSVDFTNYGREIPMQESKSGDLILFTGTDSTVRVVGHMGIVVENNSGDMQFIHSSSGTANGVVITKLKSYDLGRFVKTIRVFKALD
jgi:cell wall-associated NlpC family hydrolase